jgi:hypothetical protein
VRRALLHWGPPPGLFRLQPMKFRKKPVMVDALQWTGENWDELCRFARDRSGVLVLDGPYPNHDVRVKTLEDGKGESQVEHVASCGDWIVKGVRGEFYAVKPEIFEETYEPA